jgi:hypothetical protein
MSDAAPKKNGPVHRALRWWRARRLRTRVFIVLGVLAAILVIPFATTQLAFEDAGASAAIPEQEEPDQATRNELARRFAPVLRLDSRELFVPIDAGAYLSATNLDSRLKRLVALVKARPSLDDLTAKVACAALAPPCALFLDVQGVEPPHGRPRDYDRVENQLLGDGARRIVYSHVTRYKGSGEYAIQYWFLYFFNYRLNEHESDWEQITIHLDKDKKPLEAFFSSHASGQKRVWARMERSGDHPVDYVAEGSHANYFAPGTHSVTIVCTPVLKRLKVCVRKRVVLDLANGKRELRPGRGYELRELSGTAFPGGWGSGNFVAGLRTKDVVTDPRLRRAWLDPLARFQHAKLIAGL